MATYYDSLPTLMAFAEVNGLVLVSGIGCNAHKFQIAKQAGDAVQPLSQYLPPELLASWIDGYEMGRKATRPTAPKRGRKPQA